MRLSNNIPAISVRFIFIPPLQGETFGYNIKDMTVFSGTIKVKIFLQLLDVHLIGDLIATYFLY
jgi:hypothetical protein